MPPRSFLATVSLLGAVAGCTDQPLPTSPAVVTTPKATVYTASVSGTDVLGTYLGSTYNIARDVNSAGDIVGVTGNETALWPTGTAVVPSSTAPIQVSLFGEAQDVNDVDQVAGFYGNYAALWTKVAGSYVRTDIGADLEAPPFNAFNSAAYGMNAQGQVVGTYTILPVGPAPTSLITRCFVWTPSTPNGTTGSVIDIGTLGGRDCIPNEINSLGVVAGASTPLDPVNAGPLHAFVWSLATGMTDIAPMGGYTYGASINDAGQVVGFQFTATGQHAVLWTPNLGSWTLTDLGAPTLPGQSGIGMGSHGLDINDAGFVVGFTRDDDNVVRAFFWQNGIFTALPDAAGAPIVSASALTNLLGNVVIVAGGSILDPALNTRQALRWALTVTPVVPQGCLQQLAALVKQYQLNGTLRAGEARSLLAKLDATARQIDQRNTTPARNILNAFINEVNALVASGRLSATDAQPLLDGAMCAIREL